MSLFTRTASSPDLRNLSLAEQVVSTEAAPRAGLKRTVSSSDVTVLKLSPEFSSQLASTKAAKEAAVKAAAAATEAFNRAKASSKSYGISTIHYGLILPLKEMVIGLTDEQTTNLDLYRKHTALCSGIKTVQKAYKTYIAAQEAEDKAPTNPVTAREGARRQAFGAGSAMVKNYQGLIELAIGQAENIGVDKAKYLKDLNTELDKATRGLILKTVNKIRPKMDIEKDLLNDKETLKATLSARYQKFATEFVSNIQEARSQSGAGDSSTISAIKEAFIQGLASIPELGRLNDGLFIIELYHGLIDMPMDPAPAIQHFSDTITALMNSPKLITDEDLQNIQFQGISLESVLGSIDVDKLNELKGLRSQLQVVQGQIQATKAEIEGNKGIVAETMVYNFSEVQAFIMESGGDAERVSKTLLEVPQEYETALGRLAKSYKEKIESHDALTAQVKEVRGQQAKTMAAINQEIWVNQVEVTELEIRIDVLDQAILDRELDLAAKKEVLEAFRVETQAKKKKFIGKKDSAHMKTAMARMFQSLDDEITVMEAEIEPLDVALKVNLNDRAVRQARLDTLNVVMPAMVKDTFSLDIQYAQTIHDLDEELKALQTDLMVGLSGEDIKVITEKLVIGLAGREQKTEIAQQWKKADEAYTRIAVLTRTELQLRQDVDAIKERMESSLVTLNDEQAFVLRANIFGKDQEAVITTQLKSNLVIAKKVTLEVGREIVKQGDESLKQKAAEDTGSYKSQIAYVGKTSKLGLKLDKLEAEEENKDSLDQLVQAGVAKLPLVISKKPEDVLPVLMIADFEV